MDKPEGLLPNTEPMMLQDLLDQVISRGIAEIQNSDRPELAKEGCVRGFEQARELPTMEDFEWAITQANEKLIELRKLLSADRNDENYRNFWVHRHATAQLEWCYEILKVARHVRTDGSLPPGIRLSTRAVMQYARIVGISES